MYAIKRSAFAMILAIFVVMMIAMGGALILRNASSGTKSTIDNYLRAQADLLADSAIEFVAMQMQGIVTNAVSTPCLNRLNISVRDQSDTMVTYEINSTLRYSFVNIVAHSADGCNRLAPDRVGDGNSMVLIDVTVTTRDESNLSTEPIRIHKSSFQKL